MLAKLWGFLMFFAGAGWLISAAQVIFDPHYQPGKLTMVVAFVMTAILTIKWGMEYWNEK